MTTAQIVETSVTVNNNSPIQVYVHPDDQTQPTLVNAFSAVIETQTEYRKHWDERTLNHWTKTSLVGFGLFGVFSDL